MLYYTIAFLLTLSGFMSSRPESKSKPESDKVVPPPNEVLGNRVCSLLLQAVKQAITTSKKSD